MTPVSLDTLPVVPETPLDIPVHPDRDTSVVSGESGISTETSEAIIPDISTSESSS